MDSEYVLLHAFTGGRRGHADIMKNVNTVQMEELSEDQIKAARERRLKERCAVTETCFLCGGPFRHSHTVNGAAAEAASHTMGAMSIWPAVLLCL